MTATPFTPQLRRRTLMLAALFVVSLFTAAYFSNLISYRHHHRWDLTQSGKYTLDPRTVAALERVDQLLPDDQPLIVVTCFAPQAAGRPGESVMVRRLEARVNETLGMFKSKCKRLEIQKLDPFQHKNEMDKLVQHFGGIDLVDTIVVMTRPAAGVGSGGSGDKALEGHEFIKRHQLADFDFGSRRVTRWKTERALIQAMQQVVGESRPQFYVTSGAGERSLGRMTALRSLFAPGNVDISTLAPTRPLPTDPSSNPLLILAAPRGDLSASRASELERWLMRGGRALFVLPPIGTPRPRIEALLKRLGAQVPGKLVVADRKTQFLVAHAGARHPISGDLPVSQRVLLRTAQCFEKAEVLPPLHRYTPLIVTGKEARWEHVADRKGQRQQTQRDEQYHLAVALKWPARDADGTPLSTEGNEKWGRLVLIGSQAVLENQVLERAGIANRSLVYNSAMWLIDRDELLSSTHTGQEFGQLQLDQAQKRKFLLLLVLTPTLAFFAGIIVWLFRKD